MDYIMNHCSARPFADQDLFFHTEGDSFGLERDMPEIGDKPELNSVY